MRYLTFLAAAVVCTALSGTAYAMDENQVPFNRSVLYQRYVRRVPCNAPVATEHSMVATERTIDYYPGTVVTGAIEDLVCQTRISLHFSRRTSHPYIRKLSFDKTKGAECVLHKKEEGFWPWGKTRKNFVTNIRVMAAGAIALRQTSCTADSKTDGATFKKEYIPAVPKVHVDDDADSGEVIVAENNLAKKVPEPTGTITPVPIVIASAIVTPFDASLPEETLMETPEASDEMDEAEASAHPIPSALVTPDHDVLINLNTVARGKVSGMYDNQGDMETKKYVDNIPKTAAEEKKIFKDDGVIDDQFRRKELIKEAPAETYAPECQLNFNSINHIIAYLVSVGYDFYFDSVLIDSDIVSQM